MNQQKSLGTCILYILLKFAEYQEINVFVIFLPLDIYVTLIWHEVIYDS